MSLVRKIVSVGLPTFFSRILGLVRDLLMARYLGAGLASDAFFIAFKLPNFFRRMFAEGAFSAGFVPLFSRALGKDITPESQIAAEAFASRALAWLLPVLAVMLIIMELAMAQVMYGLTGGFAEEGGNPEKFNLVVELGRYTFPYLLLVSLVSFFSSMLNAVGKFTAAALAPVLLNMIMITTLATVGNTTVETARGLAIAVSAAGVVQLVWVYVAAKKAGLKVHILPPKLTDDVRELLRVMAPVAIGAGIMQINLLMDVVIAARMLPEGSVSWLFYADRLSQLPLGVIGIAAGTVLLPGISRLLAGGDAKGAAVQQNRALEFTMLLTLPAAAALGTIATPIIATLFERNAFTVEDTAAAAAALVAYAAGLPAYVIQKTLTPAYFARQDTKTPVVFATIAMVSNLILNLILIRYFAHVGLALATAIAAWLNVALLYGELVRRGYFQIDRRLLLASLKFIVASGAMAATLVWARGYINHYFADDGAIRIGALLGLIAMGLSTYLLCVFLLGGVDRKAIRTAISRKS